MSLNSHLQLVEKLQARWPESRPEPSLERIRALCDLLGNPEKFCPVIQIAGTNGKGSTAIMVESLIRSMGLRTGRFSSPHLEDVCERIAIDGQPISHELFDETWHSIASYVEVVDRQNLGNVPMTFFEVMTAMAYTVFADAPVDVMIIECGMGGSWDATNVADADVAVICPIDYDHTQFLGTTLEQIAGEKAGIIKENATAIICGQESSVAKVLLARCAEVGAVPILEGPDFGLVERKLAVDGQLLKMQTSYTTLSDVYLPLHGEHMARNSSLALAAVEALFGRELSWQVVSEGFEIVKAPARIEVIHREPTVLLDTCHNPHGARATIDAIVEAFSINPVVGVVSMMKDKNITETLEIFAELMNVVVVTKTSLTERGMGVAELAELARPIFGAGRVEVADSIPEAISKAMALADSASPDAAVLIAGSVIGAGEARAFLNR